MGSLRYVGPYKSCWISRVCKLRPGVPAAVGPRFPEKSPQQNAPLPVFAEMLVCNPSKVMFQAAIPRLINKSPPN